MHRAAAPVRDAGFLAKQFRHYVARLRAFGDAVAVLAIGRDHVVLVAERLDGADRDRLFARIRRTEAGDLALGTFRRLFLRSGESSPSCGKHRAACASSRVSSARCATCLSLSNAINTHPVRFPTYSESTLMSQLTQINMNSVRVTTSANSDGFSGDGFFSEQLQLRCDRDRRK